MSRDIQFISIVDDLQVTGVEDLEGADPRTLRVSGRGGFNSAQRVLINDFAVDSFTIATDRLLLVAPGAQFDDVPISQMRVLVVAGALTGTGKVRLLFGPTKNTRAVEGIQKLVQQTVKMLLSNVGSNRYRKDEGGDLVRALGVTLTQESRSRTSTLLARAVGNTERQLIAGQATERSIPAEERLLSLSLNGIVFDDVNQEVQAAIRLISFAGRELNIPLIL